MRVAVIGPQNVGKSFFIEKFLSRNPKYSKPTKTYRDIIKEKGLNLNRQGDQESQNEILIALSDQAILNAENKYCIHDRCVLDNLVYTMYLHLTDPEKISGEFLKQTINVVKTSLPFYDVIFFISSSNPKNVVEDKENNPNRDKDKEYQTAINNLYLSILEEYKSSSGRVFPREDCPALIEIYGDEMENEKTDMVAEYINLETGDLVETTESVLEELQDLALYNDIKA